MTEKTNQKPARFKASTFMPLEQFIEMYMEVYKAKWNNNDLAARLNIDLRRVYVLREHANKVLKEENVELPKLFPYNRKYGSGTNPKLLAQMVKENLRE